MQRLATIEKILNIEPHPDADTLDIYQVMGWKVIDKKGAYNVGDLAIYVEIDTIFPEKPENLAFLEKNHWKVKTIRLRGVYSQGLLLPLSVLPEDFEIEEGKEVADIIGCQKYEKSSGVTSIEAKSTFPYFVGWNRTDEDNICSNLYMLEQIKGKPYYITLKADGSSLSSIYQDEFILATRKMWLREIPDDAITDNKFWLAARNRNLKEILSKSNYGIQCELLAPGLQCNTMGVNQADIRVYDLFDKTTKKYTDYQELVDFCVATNLPMVDVIEEGENFNYTLDELVKMAFNAKYPNGKLAEGIVVRPTQYTVSDRGGRLSFKVMNPEYDRKN